MPDKLLAVRIRRCRFVTLCGRIFRDTDSSYFPQTGFRGRTLYFCTDSCLGAFRADPEAFYRAHRRSNQHPLQKTARSLPVGGHDRSSKTDPL